MTCDPHHILGRGWHGADEDQNLLGVCRPCHDSVNGTIAGKVLSLHAKFMDQELDLDWFEGRVGYSVRTSYLPSLPPLVTEAAKQVANRKSLTTSGMVHLTDAGVLPVRNSPIKSTGCWHD